MIRPKTILPSEIESMRDDTYQVDSKKVKAYILMNFCFVFKKNYPTHMRHPLLSYDLGPAFPSGLLDSFTLFWTWFDFNSWTCYSASPW